MCVVIRPHVLAKPFYSFARLAHDTRIHTNPHKIRDKRKKGEGRPCCAPSYREHPHDNNSTTTLNKLALAHLASFHRELLSARLREGGEREALDRSAQQKGFPHFHGRVKCH